MHKTAWYNEELAKAIPSSVENCFPSNSKVVHLGEQKWFDQQDCLLCSLIFVPSASLHHRSMYVQKIVCSRLQHRCDELQRRDKKFKVWNWCHTICVLSKQCQHLQFPLSKGCVCKRDTICVLSKSVCTSSSQFPPRVVCAREFNRQPIERVNSQCTRAAAGAGRNETGGCMSTTAWAGCEVEAMEPKWGQNWEW